MKDLTFIFVGLILFSSCQNNTSDKEENTPTKSEEVMTTDNLPDAKWNGEYMEIKDEDKSHRNPRVLGSEYYNMGNVALEIGDNKMTYISFVRDKNVLSFTQKSIDAFITSAKNEQIHLYFEKDQILTKSKGKYKANPEGNSNTFFTMRVSAKENGMEREYTLQSGVANLTKFSPQIGTFVMDINGVFVDTDGKEFKGSGKIKMNFETVVMKAP